MDTALHDFDLDLGLLPVTFVPGRIDCATSPYDDSAQEEFPSAHAGSKETFEYFDRQFGLTQYETVIVACKANPLYPDTSDS